jgi:endonuclease/exonuclease/phosphatase family metal-dependent hydrolase
MRRKITLNNPGIWGISVDSDTLGVTMNRLARVAGILSFLLYLSSGPPAGATPVELTVMTQNLYLGANTDAVLASPSAMTLQAALDSIVANKFSVRAGAIATEAANAGGPALIGLQEAYIISAPNVNLDYTQILLDQLATRGLNYTVAGVHTGFSVATSLFSVTEREVVLARTGVPDLTITGSESHTFVNNVTTALGPLNRGYALVDATLDGTPFQFVSTHLDSTKSIGEAQAGELLARLGMTAEPQLVVGDFNALPTDATHADMVAAGFIDVGGAVGAVGATCCQAPDLDNPVSQLSGRIDYVFDRGFSSIDSAFIVGDQPFENVRPRWPSDHAGVIAAVDVPEPSAGALFAAAMLLFGALRLRAPSRDH